MRPRVTGARPAKALAGRRRQMVLNQIDWSGSAGSGGGAVVDGAVVATAVLAAAATGVPLGLLLRRERRSRRAAVEVQARVEEFASRQREQIEIVGTAVRTILRQEDGAAAIVAAAQQITGAASVTLWQPDGHGDVVCTSAVPDSLMGLRTEVGGSGAVARCLASGRPVQIDEEPHPGLDRHLLRSARETTGLRLSAGEAVPIIDAGRCLGVLGLAWEPGQEGLGRNRAMLELLAAETALALAHQALLIDLERLSLTDTLTGVANRRAWELAVGQGLPRALRENTPLSFLLIDLDHFKAFNDEHGHAHGDQFLKAATQAWSNRLRRTDLLCRWGGEEFVVMLLNCDLARARTVADELRSGMPEPMTCSIGVAQWDREETVEELMNRADACLYKAKATGRDRVCADPEFVDRSPAL